jgi:hypothetical protein
MIGVLSHLYRYYIILYLVSQSFTTSQRNVLIRQDSIESRHAAFNASDASTLAFVPL